jgi:predicted hotdog family 3-hydroxylacyl-ACP dehydratase
MDNSTFTLPLSKEQTEAIIPQKQPFVLISSLINASEKSCETSFTIPDNHVLLTGKHLSSSGIIENIAQSCAAMMGYVNRNETGKPKVGFIGDIRNFQCSALPAVGATIQTLVTIENQVFDVTIIEGKVFMDGKQIAACKMKIFVKPD